MVRYHSRTTHEVAEYLETLRAFTWWRLRGERELDERTEAILGEEWEALLDE